MFKTLPVMANRPEPRSTAYRIPIVGVQQCTRSEACCMNLPLSPHAALTASASHGRLKPEARPLERRLRRLTDSWYGAAFGALAYGAWAVFANWDSGASIALQIGAAHWLMSTLLTVYGTAVMRAFHATGRTPVEGAVLAVVCGMSFTYALLIGVHRFIGTPHIALTLAPGLIPTVAFCVGYALLLHRTSAQPTDRV